MVVSQWSLNEWMNESAGSLSQTSLPQSSSSPYFQARPWTCKAVPPSRMLLCCQEYGVLWGQEHCPGLLSVVRVQWKHFFAEQYGSQDGSDSSSTVVEAEWAEASFFLHKPTFRLPEFSLVNKESNLVHSIFNKFTRVPEIMEERNRVTFSSGFYLHGNWWLTVFACIFQVLCLWLQANLHS